MQHFAFPVQMVAVGTEIYHRKGEASLINRKDGKYWLAYGRYRSRGLDETTPIEGDNDKAAIVAIQLDEQGQVVDEKEHIWIPEPEQGLNVMAPALRRLPDGRIGMLYSNRLSTKEAQRMFTASTDEGQTWSEPIVITETSSDADSVASSAYTTGCHDRFNVLSNGDLIAPLHGTDDWDTHYIHVRVARSADSGMTWNLSAPVELPQVGTLNSQNFFTESGCVEPGVVEREDGSLLMVLRTAMGTLFSSESQDCGKTWSGSRSMEVISPQAPAHLSRIPGSSHLLLVWTSDYDASASLGGRRHTIMTCISKDGGQSWPHESRKVLLHDPERHTDYPTVLYRGEEVWITVRVADGPNILDGLIGTGLLRVPISWLYK